MNLLLNYYGTEMTLLIFRGRDAVTLSWSFHSVERSLFDLGALGIAVLAKAETFINLIRYDKPVCPREVDDFSSISPFHGNLRSVCTLFHDDKPLVSHSAF